MYTARMERSVVLAKDMAERLAVDLFDDHRRGRFREIVQNCVTCAYHSQCQDLLTSGPPIDRVPVHCRNAHFFSPTG